MACRKWAEVCGELETRFSLYVFCAAQYFFFFSAGQVYISCTEFSAKRAITVYVSIGVRELGSLGGLCSNTGRNCKHLSRNVVYEHRRVGFGAVMEQ